MSCVPATATVGHRTDHGCAAWRCAGGASGCHCPHWQTGCRPGEGRLCAKRGMGRALQGARRRTVRQGPGGAGTKHGAGGRVRSRLPAGSCPPVHHHQRLRQGAPSLLELPQGHKHAAAPQSAQLGSGGRGVRSIGADAQDGCRGGRQAGRFRVICGRMAAELAPPPLLKLACPGLGDGRWRQAAEAAHLWRRRPVGLLGQGR